MSERADLPSVSVIVATRDRPGLLERAVEAILHQDYRGRVECVVVYDHTDVRDLDVEIPAGRELVLTSNTHAAGLPGGRNSGAETATGELLAFCDDDDHWLPEKLRRQVDLLQSRPELGAVSCGIVLKGPGIDRERSLDRVQVTYEDLLADRVMEVHSSTMLVRRSAFEAAGPVDEAIPGGYSEDYEWLLRLSKNTPIGIVSSALVVVNWHGGSFYFGRWATIVDAQRYLLAKHPDLQL
ncbi:MAG TPA: glycosyltransferase family A protein, partial [Micromonosporaceae bacterium]|nr:glycosyltransferase family A protein [Micromonosporaceae bacterium]